MGQEDHIFGKWVKWPDTEETLMGQRDQTLGSSESPSGLGDQTPHKVKF